MLNPKLNRILQVRRMTSKDYEPVPAEIVEEICNKTIEKLREQSLRLVKDYSMRIMLADKYIQCYRNIDFIDGNELIQRFARVENPYLFFIPLYCRLADGPADKALQKHTWLGEGRAGVSLIDLDFNINYYRRKWSTDEFIMFGETKMSKHKMLSVILHELGHDLYSLGNHKREEKYCAMSITTNTTHYCMRCKKKAKKLEAALAQQYAAD